MQLFLISLTRTGIRKKNKFTVKECVFHNEFCAAHCLPYVTEHSYLLRVNTGRSSHIQVTDDSHHPQGTRTGGVTCYNITPEFENTIKLGLNVICLRHSQKPKSTWAVFYCIFKMNREINAFELMFERRIQLNSSLVFHMSLVSSGVMISVDKCDKWNICTTTLL